jgi:hypothetical protein
LIQRRCTTAVPNIQIRAGMEESCGDLHLALHGRLVQSRNSGCILGFDCGALSEQQFHHGDAAPVGRQMERSGARAIRRIDIGALGDQQRRDVRMIRDDGIMQGSRARLRMPRIHVGACVQQQRDDGLFSGPDGIVQRGPAPRIGGIEGQALLKQDANTQLVACPDGLAQVIQVAAKSG